MAAYIYDRNSNASYLMPASVELTENLTLFVRGGAVQLSPSQCFKLAEKCLRGATRQIVRAEAAEAADENAAPKPGGGVQ